VIATAVKQAQRVGRRLHRSAFMRGLAILTSASVFQTVVTFAAAPIVSRLFDPHDFGISGLIQALAAVPTLAASGQYYAAIGKARSRGEAVNLAMLSLLIAPVVSALLLPVTIYFLFNPQLLPNSVAPVAGYLWMIPASMIAGSWLFVTRLWEVRHRHYGFAIRSRLLETGGAAVAQIGLGLLAPGPFTLLLGRWLGVASAAAYGLRTFARDVTRGRGGIRLRRMAVVARRHWEFPAYQLPGQALSDFSRQLVPILLGVYYAIESVGFYWFANRLLQRPAQIYGANVGRVFFQHASDRRRDRRPVSGLFWGSSAALFFISLVPFGILMAFGPQIFAWAFGANWERAGQIAQWLAFANFANIVGFPARGVTQLFGMQKSFALVETARALLSAGTIVAVAHAGGEMLVAVAAVAILQSLITLGWIVAAGLRLRRVDRGLAGAE
jgi:O-antigen/teichoic acid export membrane protein